MTGAAAYYADSVGLRPGRWILGRSGEINPRDLAAYLAQSKTAKVLFAVELDRRVAEEEIRGYAAHPGIIVGTNLGSSIPADQVRAMQLATGLVDESGRPVIDPGSGKKTAQQGAATIVFGATSPLFAGIGGVYLKDNDISPLDDAAYPNAQGAELIRSQNIVVSSIDPRSACGR